MVPPKSSPGHKRSTTRIPERPQALTQRHPISCSQEVAQKHTREVAKGSSKGSPRSAPKASPRRTSKSTLERLPKRHTQEASQKNPQTTNEPQHPWAPRAPKVSLWCLAGVMVRPLMEEGDAQTHTHLKLTVMRETPLSTKCRSAPPPRMGV